MYKFWGDWFELWNVTWNFASLELDERFPQCGLTLNIDTAVFVSPTFPSKLRPITFQNHFLRRLFKRILWMDHGWELRQHHGSHREPYLKNRYLLRFFETWVHKSKPNDKIWHSYNMNIIKWKTVCNKRKKKNPT